MNPPHLAQTNFLGLLSETGFVAKIVLLILFASSVLCWGIIFMKWRSLRRALNENTEFLNVFWHGQSIDEIFAKSDKFMGSPVAAVFKSGAKELKKLSTSDLPGDRVEQVDNVHRALQRAASTEISFLEKNIGWLATTASAAPFVGLFGTVWGIMNSFQSIGITGAANLAVVAPGISEALVTTATGIAAAIPAVIAYNHFVGQIKRIAVDIECFSQDFVNIIQRSIMSGKKGPGT